jgi:hypothetical protein
MKKILGISLLIVFSSLNSQPLKFQQRNDLNKEFYDKANNNLEKFKEKINNIRDNTPKNERMELCLGVQEDIQKEFNEKLPNKTFVKRVSKTASNKVNFSSEIDLKIINGFENFKNKKVLFVGNWNKYILYKPIRIKHECLSCHGDNISDKDEKLMKSIYSNNQFKQTFKENDLIGIWKSQVSKGY